LTLGFWVALGGAFSLFLLDLALSALLAAVTVLGRVTLHRIRAEEGEHLEFIEQMASGPTSHRIAALAFRQLALLGGCFLTGVAATVAGWPRPWIIGVVAGVVVGVLVLETAVAQWVAQRYPRGVLRLSSGLLRVLHGISYPVAKTMARFLARAREEAPNGQEENGEEVEEDEAEALIEVAEQEGILEEDEGRMIRSIVDLDETLVREIMTPRTDIVGLSSALTVREALQELRQAHHSRLPVYRDAIDDVVGILHVRDMLEAWDDGRENAPITAYVRPALFVPETLSVADLLSEMRVRTHVALVVDEYGGIAGLVTLEDLLEEIVGEIRDEHDREEDLVQEEANGTWKVSALAHVKELETLFDLEFEEERPYDTVGGLVVSTLGRIPGAGESVEVQGLRIDVVQADSRRVYIVRVKKIRGQEDAAGRP
jgi:CBS domain containing-hemolysin-like protein